MHFNFVVRGHIMFFFLPVFNSSPRTNLHHLSLLYSCQVGLLGDLFWTIHILLKGIRYKVYRFKTIQLSNVKSGLSGQGGKYVISLSNKNDDSWCDKDAKITKHTFCLKNHNINAILSRK